MQLNNFNPAEKFWELIIVAIFGEVLTREIQHVQFGDDQKTELTAKLQAFFDNLDNNSQKLFGILFNPELATKPHEEKTDLFVGSIKAGIKNSEFAQKLRGIIYPEKVK